MPLVSFVVTCHNLESFIGAALDSIFAQTATNDYEVIILDDASTDSTPGADLATKCGSRSRFQTCDRLLLISGAPEKWSFIASCPRGS